MSAQVKWWRRPWVAPLMVLTVAFLAFSVPPYLTLDPAQSRLSIRENAPLHYPVLVAHILFGSVALIATCLQVWPWFRGRYPVAHRRIGRIYVFAGVLPSALLAIPTSVYGHSGLSGSIGNLLLACTWLATTVAGFRMARQRRFAEHRRWMIRSFALTASIITNRVWIVLWIIILSPQLSTTFGGSEVALRQTVSGLSGWLGWVVPLLIAQWWLERGEAAKRRARASNATSQLV
jgi:uncharacterized membrane protein YozB (DUF420 family)